MMEGYSSGSAAIPFPPLSLIPHSSSFDPSQAIAQFQIMVNPNTNTNTRKRARQLGAASTNSDQSLKTERDRRLKMSHMFSQLQATVPGLLPKATREVIVNETIKYIKELEKKKQELEEVKEESMKQVQGKSMVPCYSSSNSSSSSNRNCSITVTTTVSNNVAFFGVQSEARAGFITVIFKVFSKHRAEILAANVSVNQGNLVLAITAVLQDGGDGNGAAEMIKREIMSL